MSITLRMVQSGDSAGSGSGLRNVEPRARNFTRLERRDEIDLIDRSAAPDVKEKG